MQQSDAQVVLWCTRAAEQDYPSACLRLGHAYNFGHFGLDISFTFAASYYERAVKGGDTDGMGCFAECLLRGEGVDASEAKAMYWYSRNCGGDISAEMWFSGGSYYHHIPPRRPDRALYWLGQAVSLGHVCA